MIELNCLMGPIKSQPAASRLQVHIRKCDHPLTYSSLPIAHLMHESPPQHVTEPASCDSRYHSLAHYEIGHQQCVPAY